MEIGERIRALRIERGLTQEELADRAELSKGFISQMERDLTSPSIATLEDILTCLGTDLSAFFSGGESRQTVFTEEDYFVKRDQDRLNTIEWIVPNAQKNRMEPIRLTLEPGGRTMPDDPHEGEEFGYVIRGRITVHIGKDEFAADAGDSFYLYPEKEHYITSQTGAEIIWVSAPPSF
ncbi:MAG: helix-turn-helix domain-containing protein [Mogibacterium sp.]|nr:helix-turn-helix domain-containing protein [Mogibacterium sp.]